MMYPSGVAIESSGGQWSKGKAVRPFNPLGPWLVTPDEVPDPQRLSLVSVVNGKHARSLLQAT